MGFVTTLHLQASADAALSCEPGMPVTRGGHGMNHYFIPQQSMQLQASTITRLPTIFNTSAKTTSGKSLYDALLSEPNNTTQRVPSSDFFHSDIIAFTIDTEKMYQ